MDEYRKRITVNPDHCGGRACIRGLPIRVIDVLFLVMNGMSFEQIIEEEFLELEKNFTLFSLKHLVMRERQSIFALSF